jgi:4-hydroxybenzoate polyprenyltransferase
MVTLPKSSNTSLGAELMKQAQLYAELMRLNRPIGIWLLMWPTLWALWIVGEGHPDPKLFVVFVLGVIVMRSAGCVVNDLADRKFDAHVMRTSDRPLAAGTVTPVEAIVLFISLGLIAIALLLTLNNLTRLLAIVAVFLTVIYPFTKRFLSAPQLILGAAFGWSVPMVFAAATNEVPRLAWLIWLTVIIWAVIYDTMYAMADRDEDARIGIKSTAILFGNADIFIITLLQAVLLLAFVLIGATAKLGNWFLASVATVAIFMIYQYVLIRDRQPDRCFQAFLNNRHVGATIFAGILLDYTFR